MNKIKEIFFESIIILIAILLIFFFKSEIIITIFALSAIIITFIIKYHKKEIYVLIFGIFMGIIFELIGNILLGQIWGEASFFKIPIWLPLTWGYGFILIRRVGNILVK